RHLSSTRPLSTRSLSSRSRAARAHGRRGRALGERQNEKERRRWAGGGHHTGTLGTHRKAGTVPCASPHQPVTCRPLAHSQISSLHHRSFLAATRPLRNRELLPRARLWPAKPVGIIVVEGNEVAWEIEDERTHAESVAPS